MDKLLPVIAALLIVCFVDCSQSSYQTKYVTPGEEGNQEIARGAYTTVKTCFSDSTFVGELIFIDDSIYFLSADNQLIIYPIEQIVTLNAQLTRFKERSYLALMAIAVPSLLGLLAKSEEVNTLGTVGLVASGPGLFALFFENAKRPQFISYPDLPMEAFKKYARFPEILPENFQARPIKYNDHIALGVNDRF